MDRRGHHAMIAQYALSEASGEGRVEFDQAVKSYTDVTLYGRCEQDGTPTPDSPVPVRGNDGRFASRGQNLIDISTVQLGRAQYGGGAGYPIELVQDIACATMLIDGLVGDTEYTIKTESEKLWRLSEMDAHGICTKNWNWYAPAVQDPGRIVPITTRPSTVRAWLTIKDEDGAAISAVDVAAANPRIIPGIYDKETIPPYTPYYDGGMAQAPELYGIGDVRDEWDPLTGRGIRRLKKLVLDGSENWVLTSAGYETSDPFQGFSFVQSYLLNFDMQTVCSHFRYSSNQFLENVCSFVASNGHYHFRITASTGIVPNKTVDEWSAFLLRQNAAGTPVTAWCALAEPEPFETAPAPLSNPTGYAQIIQLDGAVADCPIKAKYLTHS